MNFGEWTIGVLFYIDKLRIKCCLVNGEPLFWVTVAAGFLEYVDTMKVVIDHVHAEDDMIFVENNHTKGIWLTGHIKSSMKFWIPITKHNQAE